MRRWFSTVKRNSRFKSLSASDVDYFQSILRPEGVVTDEERVTIHNVDWLHKYRGRSPLVLKPKTTGIFIITNVTTIETAENPIIWRKYQKY